MDDTSSCIEFCKKCSMIFEDNLVDSFLHEHSFLKHGAHQSAVLRNLHCAFGLNYTFASSEVHSSNTTPQNRGLALNKFYCVIANSYQDISGKTIQEKRAAAGSSAIQNIKGEFRNF